MMRTTIAAIVGTISIITLSTLVLSKNPTEVTDRTPAPEPTTTELPEATITTDPREQMQILPDTAEAKTVKKVLVQKPKIKRPVQKQTGPRYTELVSPVDFLNSPPVTINQFVGKKVIMVTFITYTCINCQNTFSFLKKMQDTYTSQGLQIIAVHTPEFSYEKLKSNVQPALDAAGFTFPVALDNNYETWNAYKNHYWPARYIIDLNGNVIYTHAGEGAYEETEQIIVRALNERSTQTQ
jgi:thiol-disulfide isomerase/thioredoxin